jgi:ABC-type multidrug transport system fused ATPase/permease subunit
MNVETSLMGAVRNRARSWYESVPLDPVDIANGASPTQLLWTVLRADRRVLIRGMIAGTLWFLAIAAAAPVVGLTIDRGVDGGRPLPWLALLAVVGALIAITDAVRHYHASRLYTMAHMRLARTVTAHVVDDPGLDQVRPPGDVASAISNDADRIGGLADTCCRGVGSVVAFVAVSIGLLISSWQIGLLIVVGTPVALLAAAPLWRPLERRNHTAMQVLGTASARAGDALAGLRVANGVGAGPELVRRFEEHSIAVRDATLSARRIEAGWRAIEVGLPGLFLASVLWVGGTSAARGDISAGELIAYLGLATYMAMPVATFVEVGAVLSEARASARRLLDVLHSTNTLPDADDDPAVSVTVPLGMFTAVVGRPALLDAVRASATGQSRGAIRVDGESDRLTWLVSPSDPFLFAGTVASNIAVGAAASRPIDRSVLVSCAVDEFIDSFPDGIDEDVSETGRSLSGGQRQRVALARALHHGAGRLLLIEPTSAVDAATEAVIAPAIARLRRGQTTVVATVSPLLVGAADVVIVVGDDGAELARGTPSVLGDHPALRRLLDGTDDVDTVDASGGRAR